MKFTFPFIIQDLFQCNPIHVFMHEEFLYVFMCFADPGGIPDPPGDAQDSKKSSNFC